VFQGQKYQMADFETDNLRRYVSAVSKVNPAKLT
jgi:hypothetical protein